MLFMSFLVITTSVFLQHPDACELTKLTDTASVGVYYDEESPELENSFETFIILVSHSIFLN